MPRPSHCGTDSFGARDSTGPIGYFTVNFLAALGSALVAAVVVAPLAAMAVAAAGWRFPFPRIFDRTVMLTLVAALGLFARRLRLGELLRRGFRGPRSNVSPALWGFAIAIAGITLLFVLAAVASGNHGSPLRQGFPSATAGPSARAACALMLRYLPAAILIGVLEEGFFRAFLLAGMEDDVGSSGAWVLSSAVFAVTHIVRSPARFYLTGLHPAAGAETLARSAERLANPGEIASAVGLFMIGLVLGEAFILTRRVYCSIGLHAGFVLGEKTWRLTMRRGVPRWLAGPGPVPLLAAPAAWIVSAIVLLVLRVWRRPKKEERGE